MPLNLGGGEFTPHIRWNASTSTWTMGTEQGQQQIQIVEMVVDLDNIRTGWAVFAPGEAPAWAWDESLVKPRPKPDQEREWKRAFSVNCYSPATFGGDGVREWATSSKGALMGVEALYEQYEKEAPQNPGKVPVVAFSGGKATKVGKGNTSVPQLSITKWIDRPAALKGEGQPTAAAPAPQPPQPAPPPAAPAPAPQPAMAGGSEF